MKRALSVLLTLCLAATPAIAHDWSGVVQQLYRSVGMLTTLDGEGFCSAFAIDAKRGVAMTAAHCVRSEWVAEGILLDNQWVKVVFYDEYLDTAVLQVDHLDRPDIRPRTKLIRVGMEVGSYGFAREDGLFSHFRAGNVSSIGTVEGLDGIWISVDQAGIGGMSGGPTVDTDGRLVMINQLSDRTRHFLGRDIGSVYRATAKWWKR